MRGVNETQTSMLCLNSLESMVPADHPLRPVKAMADEALRRMSALFDEMYSRVGRRSVPPERLLKGTLLIALYTIRSERHLAEQLRYNMLFRWFLDMDMVEAPFDASTFSQNRERLMKHEAAERFFEEVVALMRSKRLLSHEHFTVDGTMIDAWASLKSFKRKDDDDPSPPDDPGNPTVNFRGEKRSNETHASTTDPESRLMRKGNGKEAKLSFMGHALMENRNGLLVDFRISEANGRAERAVALQMIEESVSSKRRVTLGADRGYDTRDFVTGCRERNVTPHVAMNAYGNRSSAIDGRTTASRGYSTSQRIRKRVEEIFGWMKTIGGLRKTRYRGIAQTQLYGTMVAAAYNLLRVGRLTLAGAA